MLFFFNYTATTEIYTLSLHDALPILPSISAYDAAGSTTSANAVVSFSKSSRSEEHTSELQSQSNLVCRLLLEKKKKTLGIALLTVVQLSSIGTVSYSLYTCPGARASL